MSSWRDSQRRRDRFDQLCREPRRLCWAVRNGSDQQDYRKLSRRTCLCGDFLVHVGDAGSRVGEKNGTADGRRGCDGTRCLVRGFIVASVAAGFAVHEAVFADADVELRLTEAAKLIALALVLQHFALAAAEFSVAGSVGHAINFTLRRGMGNVPLVTGTREASSAPHYHIILSNDLPTGAGWSGSSRAKWESGCE